jgi:hypothetical protein
MGRLATFGVFDPKLYDREVKELAFNSSSRGDPVKIAEGQKAPYHVVSHKTEIDALLTYIKRSMDPVEKAKLADESKKRRSLSFDDPPKKGTKSS